MGNFAGHGRLLRHQLTVSRLRYGSSAMGARQKANFWLAGSSTLTWQVYLPGCSLAMGTLNLTGRAFDLAFKPSVICRGAVSKAFTLPRKKLTLATMGLVVSASGW